MKDVKAALDKKGGLGSKAVFRTCKTVWFQAWKYDKEEEILAALIQEIFKAMGEGNFFEKCKAGLAELTKKLDKSKIVGTITKLISGEDVTELFSDLSYKKELGFYDTFQTFFDDLIWTYHNSRPKFAGSEKSDDTKGVLVIFIDDLDRCPKGLIVKVLETIKLFMDKEVCVFVIGADHEIIESALSAYLDIDRKNLILWNIIDDNHPPLKRDLSENRDMFTMLRQSVGEIDKAESVDRVLWDIAEESLTHMPRSLFQQVPFFLVMTRKR